MSTPPRRSPPPTSGFGTDVQNGIMALMGLLQILAARWIGSVLDASAVDICLWFGVALLLWGGIPLGIRIKRGKKRRSTPPEAPEAD